MFKKFFYSCHSSKALPTEREQRKHLLIAESAVLAVKKEALAVLL
jgi:hypothetical protein